jgi:cytochrome c6
LIPAFLAAVSATEKERCNTHKGNARNHKGGIIMKKTFAVPAAILAVTLFATSAFCDTKGGKIDAKHEFVEHCASCHPKGGNIVNPKKTLSKKVMAANGVKNAKDIVGKMRNPGPGMTRFDAKAVSDKEATAIANYILATFP